MRQQGGAAAGLVVDLKAPETAVLGLPVLLTLSVRNCGQSTATVSARLNLMEGDVRLLVVGPDGTSRRAAGAGGQPDTFLRQATLKPGQQIVGGMNVLYTDIGDTFTEPGNYSLQAEYWPSPQAGWVASAPVSMMVRSPRGEAEQGAAALLQKEEAKLALTLAQLDRAPEELREIAERFAGTTEGKLAWLILTGGETTAEDAGDASDTFLTTDPVTTALLITSVTTPFSNVGRRLADSYTNYIGSQDAAAEGPGSADAKKKERALRIVKGQPFEDD